MKIRVVNMGFIKWSENVDGSMIYGHVGEICIGYIIREHVYSGKERCLIVKFTNKLDIPGATCTMSSDLSDIQGDAEIALNKFLEECQKVANEG